MPAQQIGKRGGSKKIGRADRESKHMSYNQRHNYKARSNPKATRHRTPLQKYKGAEYANSR